MVQLPVDNRGNLPNRLRGVKLRPGDPPVTNEEPPLTRNQSLPPRHYLILGAGAVGGTLGALLALRGRAVTLVARPAVVEAIRRQGGLRHVEAGQERLVPLRAQSHLEGLSVPGPVTLFFTMKAGDLAPALAGARRHFPAGTLAVTWQNGLRAEAEALPFFPNLLGGIVRATSTMLTPGEVRIRTPGTLIVGRYPASAARRHDPEREELLHDLMDAGFDAVGSPDILADKGLKLLVNLFSGAGPLVRLDGASAPCLTRVEQNVVIEGARVLRAAGVPFHAASGRGDDVATMLKNLAARAPRPPSSDGVHNSTWQNLATPGRRLENSYMNGEIVELAAARQADAPWNRRLMEVLEDVHRQGASPNSLTDDEFGRRFADLIDPAPWDPGRDERPQEAMAPAGGGQPG